MAFSKIVVGSLLLISSLELVHPAKDEQVGTGMEFEVLPQYPVFPVIQINQCG